MTSCMCGRLRKTSRFSSGGSRAEADSPSCEGLPRDGSDGWAWDFVARPGLPEPRGSGERFGESFLGDLRGLASWFGVCDGRPISGTCCVRAVCAGRLWCVLVSWRCAGLLRVLRPERRKLRDGYRRLPLVGADAVNEAVKVVKRTSTRLETRVARIVGWRDLRPLAQGEG
jgi:hypothetical protein